MTAVDEIERSTEVRDAAADASAPPMGAPADEPVSPRAMLWRWLERVGAVAFSFVLFNVCLSLYTRHNDFTYHYHPDESSKIAQIQEYQRLNFHHPLLLLEATNEAVKYFGADLSDGQAVVERGRWASAALGAGAAVALAWVGYASGGLLGMLIVGAAVGLCPKLLLYSHYMKEDVALVFGIALTVLGSRAAWDARRWWTRLPALVLLGAGAGVAASGKYAGLAAFALAIPAALLLPRMRLYWRIVSPVFVAWCAVVVGLSINWRIMDQSHFYAFIDGFEREAEHATSSHGGLALAKPNWWFVSLIPTETMPHARVLAGVLIVCAIGAVLRRLRRTWDVLLIAFACFYLYVLSQSVIPFNRYFLPVAVMIYLMAGLGGVALLNLFGRRGWLRVVAGVVVLGLIIVLQGQRCADYLGQMADDGRARLREYVAANVPARSRILAEDYTGLNHPPDHRPGQSFELPGSIWIQAIGGGPNAGDLGFLARRGIDYIAISDTRYNRYFAPVSHVQRGDDSIQQFRDWYFQLQNTPDRFELVWSNEPEHPTHSFTNPTLKLYRVKR